MVRTWAWIAIAFVLGTLIGAFAVAGLGQDTVPATVAAGQVAANPVGAAVLTGDTPTYDEAAPPVAEGPAPPAAQPAADPLAIDPLQARLDEIGAGWSRMQQEVVLLRRRIGDLEQRLEAVQAKPAAAVTDSSPRLSATPDGQRSALVQAGLGEDAAAELVQRQGQKSLDRLNLRDIAAREGWLGTDRYRDELARIQEDAVDLRRELGDEAYDRYLYAAGEDNRVRIDGIIPGSVGELAGLQPGDMIETYAGDHVFNYSDLRDATAGGERGELVQVRIRRGGQVFDAWVARGPLGVQLDSTAAQPR
jgi:hypothetical protein